MQARAHVKGITMSPRKMRVVANLVRGKKVEEAVGLLELMPKRAAGIIAKAIKSAAANAEDKSGGDASVEDAAPAHDRGRRRHDRQALDAAVDGPREPHQSSVVSPHGCCHGRGLAHGSENTSDWFPSRHHQDVVVSLVRREELRQVAARGPEAQAASSRRSCTTLASATSRSSAPRTRRRSTSTPRVPAS